MQQSESKEALLQFPMQPGPPCELERAKRVLDALGQFDDSQMSTWQAWALVVLSDGQTDHYISYVREAGGTFRDGIRVEKIGQAIYDLVGRLDEKPEGMDRELCRDYVLKPLIRLGIVLEATWVNESNGPVLVLGHPKAKSPNCVYRLDDDLLAILNEEDENRFQELLHEYQGELPDTRKERLAIQKAMRKSQSMGQHGSLLDEFLTVVDELLPRYEVVFSDLTDGQRISDSEEATLEKQGLSLKLKDTKPDSILFDPESRHIIAVEAVISDGEFDVHRLEGIERWAERNECEITAAVTCYEDFVTFSNRQSKHDNVAHNTYVWVRSCPDALWRKCRLRRTLAP